ncbi:MAG: HAMP domain-containing protein [Candidatus Omnitrophica bacterium]|nr:HAMP domain-containing protein [Candidatus Omnitrophota bacterium]
MSENPQFKRTQILVERNIQFRFARFVILFATATAFLTSSVVFFTMLVFLGDKLAAVYPQGRLAPIVRSAYLVFFGNLILAAPFIFYAAIRFSHRIVGPLPKMYRYLERVGKGIFPGRLTIRENDELQELAEVINRMADDLKSRGLIKESDGS